MTLTERLGASSRPDAIFSKPSWRTIGALAAVASLSAAVAWAQLPTRRPLGVESPSEAAKFRVLNGYSIWDPDRSDPPAKAKLRAQLRWIYDHNFSRVLKSDGPRAVAAENVEAGLLTLNDGRAPPSGAYITVTQPVPLRNQPSDVAGDITLIDRGFILTSDGKLQGKFLQVGIVTKDGVKMGFVVPQVIEPW